MFVVICRSALYRGFSVCPSGKEKPPGGGGSVPVGDKKAYSVRKAVTGSFRDALLAGISPEISVRQMLTAIRIRQCKGFNDAIPLTPAREAIIALTGKVSIPATTTPTSPAKNPIINVSALKTLAISFFLAPMARRIPISLVRSMTDT